MRCTATQIIKIVNFLYCFVISRRMRCAGHVARMWEGGTRNTKRRWEDDIKMNLRALELEGVDWIDRTQNRDQWWTR
jgi:hypothetical protein